MLRIIASVDPTAGMTAKLEGQVKGPWVDEVRRYCQRNLDTGPLTLDVREISFIDREGVILLKDLISRGVRLVNSTAFVAELLKTESDPSGHQP